MGTINIFEPRTMLAMVSESEFRAKTFLRDRYFGHTESFQTEAVDVDIVGRGKRKIAPFVSRRSAGSQDFRDGYSTKTYKPAYVAPFRVSTAEDALKRSAGEAIYSSKSPNQRAAEILAKDLYELDKEITRREEVMCAQALTTGKIIIKGKDVDDQLDFWDGLTTKPYVDLTATKAWNASGADPITDLRKIVRNITQLSGLTPVEVIAGSKAVDALINALKGDPTPRSAAKGSNPTSVTPFLLKPQMRTIVIVLSRLLVVTAISSGSTTFSPMNSSTSLFLLFLKRVLLPSSIWNLSS